MKKIINIGVLGCANIAVRSMIPSILSLKNRFNLVGIASRDISKAKKVALQFNIEYFKDYYSVIKNRSIDAVYIPLPNSLHFEWIKKSLLNNKHVLVEKSMCCDFQKVRQVNELAKKNNLILLENFQFRFHDQLDIIKKYIKSDSIGELRYIRSSFCFPPFKDKQNIRYKKELGGGSLLDAGAYPVKITQILLGLDLNVETSSLYYDSNYEVDIWGGAFLRQKRGAIFSEIAFGFDNYYQCNLELVGTKGKIFTDRIFTAPPDYISKIIFENAEGKKIIEVKPNNHFVKMLSYFYSLILYKENIELEYIENINQAKLLEEIKEKNTNE